MKTGTWIIGAALASAVAGLAFVSLRPETVPVDLAEVRRGPMVLTVNADGVTRIRDIYEVAAPITGETRRSPVTVGDPVTKDATVVAVVEPVQPALLDSRSRVQAEASVREAEAALRVADAQLLQAKEDRAYAQTQFDRTKTLVERGVASLTALEDAEQLLRLKSAAVDTAQSELSRAESALARASATLIGPDSGPAADTPDSCCVTLRAPADGVVLSISGISARPVQAGEPLLSIGRPDNLEIVADLLSADAVRVPDGARAIVERWGGEPALEARVRRVEPSARTKVSALGIEEQRVDAVFDLLTPPEGRAGLGDGFSVYLRIVLWEAGDVLQVPLSAVFRTGDDWAVFVEREGVAVRTRVDLGRRNGTSAEVLGGLDAGARVVTHPSDRVIDGALIAPRETL